MDTRGLNQQGDVVVSWTRAVMIPERTTGLGQSYFPSVAARYSDSDKAPL